MTPIRNLFCFSLVTTAAHAALPEVDTVFYGRVLHLGGGEEHVVTEGQLSWQIAKEGVSVLEKSTTLGRLKGGEMSYQLRVPQHWAVPATSSGTVPGLLIPTSSSELPFENTSIKLNGVPLRLADPSGFMLDLWTNQRAQFRRLDLVFDGALPDADGDGLPDWWEERYQTDSQLDDADADPDGDGVSNRNEYLRGTSPTGSDQQPRLPSELFVSLPVEGAAVPVIRAIDSDSAAADLTFTVAGLETELRIERVGDAEPVTSFTQAELDEGAIVLRHVEGELEQSEFTLILRDETAAHPAAQSTVRVSVAPAATLWSGWGLDPASLPAPLPAVQDATLAGAGVTLRAPTTDEGEDIGRLFIGSVGTDELLGSAEADVFVPGEGDLVNPGAGADSVILTAGFNEVTVRGFVAGEDVIDLRGLIEPSEERLLSDYVMLSVDTLLIDSNGDGSGFDDGQVRFEESELPTEVAELWDRGSLQTGDVVPLTKLFAETEGILAEENLSEAVLRFRRRGDASSSLEVPLALSGTATMGLDFANLPSSVCFDPGVKLVELAVVPFADDEREPTETIHVEMATGDGWESASGEQSLTLSLIDLPSRVWLEVAERVAIQEGQVPAQLIVRRSGSLGSPLTAMLSTAGQATPHVDYQRLPASVTFAAGQAAIAIDLVPTASGNLSQGAESVVVRVEPDPNYIHGTSPAAHLLIAAGATLLDDWLVENEVTEERATFLISDSDRDGIDGLAEFAHGGSPERPDRAGTAIPVRMEDGRIGIRFQRRPFAPELSYRVERSSALAGWEPLDIGEFEELPGPVLASGMQEITVLLSGERAQNTFLRVSVRIAN